MTPAEHAQLLRELENVARQFGNIMVDFGDSEEAHEAYALQARARAAAEEIEGQKVPTVDEIGHIIAASASSRSAARAVLARFGGGEVE